jgi:GNAT superfamily N-acetyltransferase
MCRDESNLPPEFLIRSATPADAAIIADFNGRLALETEGKRLDPDTALRGARLGLAHSEMCRYFLAEREGQAIGQAMVTYEWSDWRAGMFWWLQSVYVHPDFRRLGVFRRLFHHVRELAKKSPGTCGLRLYVEQHNRPAIETYGRLGMRPSGHAVYQVEWSS